MTNLENILESRDIIFPTKSHLVKTLIFPVVMYGCESWTIKKAECWTIDAFELWCWRRRLRVPWTARRSNQSILKEISPGMEGLVFGRNDTVAETPVLWPPHAKSWLIGKDSNAGRDCGQEEKGMTEAEMAGWHHWFDGHESGWTPGVGDGQGGLACFDSWGRKVGHNWATELNWTEWLMGLPWWLRWWRIYLQCRRLGFDPWVRKTPWRREWQFTPVFLPGESHGLAWRIPPPRGAGWATVHSVAKSRTWVNN